MKKVNLILFGSGVLTLIVGNILLSIGPATNVWSVSVAPAVLVLGFLAIIPFSIMYRQKESSKR